jgi:hypothetical protein
MDFLLLKTFFSNISFAQMKMLGIAILVGALLFFTHGYFKRGSEIDKINTINNLQAKNIEELKSTVDDVNTSLQAEFSKNAKLTIELGEEKALITANSVSFANNLATYKKQVAAMKNNVQYVYKYIPAKEDDTSTTQLNKYVEYLRENNQSN